ncbi:MAG TPA: hypothetical protein PKC69_10490 [Chitinophagaceae bacterium]|nr:hypothetical protein [Chitinophagaceae bacterium]
MRHLVALLLLKSLLLISCQKNNEPEVQLTTPSLSTSPIESVSNNVAASGGNITMDGGSPVTGRGICWSITPNPTIANNHTNDGTGTGLFTSTMAGLDAGKKYYVRAYATNAEGTAYGNELSFTTSSQTIYILGTTSMQPKVWKNGVSSTLPGRHANSLFVAGSDVYVVGTEATGVDYLPRVWKNGTTTSFFPDIPEITPFDVFVSNNDIYAVGQERVGEIQKARIWKNGMSIPLTIGDYSSIANTVYVSGTDIYVGGGNCLSEGLANCPPCIWKNGTPEILGTGTGQAVSVFLANGDVYIAGGEHNGTTTVAKVWKNGVGTFLGNATSYAKSIFVSGNDIYVAGNEMIEGKQIAKFWKNGTATILTPANASGSAEAVWVVGTDVYVVGYQSENSGDSKAIVWKNGVPSFLPNGDSGGASAIFITN